MKKRYIISFLLVLGILGVTHTAWLTIKPKAPVAVQQVQGGGGTAQQLPKRHSRASIKFDAMMFIIIVILGYLLSFRLTSYLAEFKLEKNYSRIDIVFLAVCALLMYLPMSHISNSKKSDVENRNLAVWKPLITQKGEINYNFGRDYDKWFNDRFNGRKILLQIRAMFNSDKNQPSVLIGKDGWLFYKGGNSVRNFLNIDKFTDKDLEYITKYLVSIDEYCRARGKRFYLMLCPDKNKIYGEYYPDYIIQNVPDSQSRAMQLINHLRKNTRISVIYPYEELHIAKKDGNLLYWKNDTHWNSLGGYIGYKSLVERLVSDGVKIKLVKPDNFVKYTVGLRDLDNMLVGLRRNVNKTEYLDAKISWAFDYSIEGTTPDDIYSHNNMFSKKNVNAPKLVMFRDSFGRAMLPFISNTFSDVSYYWDANVKKSAIEDADIVILESVERGLQAYKRLKFKD